MRFLAPDFSRSGQRARRSRLAVIRTGEFAARSAALQQAILDDADACVIVTDAKGIVLYFNAGAERMLGYAASRIVNRITPAEILDPRELSARAAELSRHHAVAVAPGFEALIFEAARCVQDTYTLNFIRKDSSRIPAIVTATALRAGAIIGYLLTATSGTACSDAGRRAARAA